MPPPAHWLLNLEMLLLLHLFLFGVELLDPFLFASACLLQFWLSFWFLGLFFETSVDLEAQALGVHRVWHRPIEVASVCFEQVLSTVDWLDLRLTDKVEVGL